MLSPRRELPSVAVGMWKGVAGERGFAARASAGCTPIFCCSSNTRQMRQLICPAAANMSSICYDFRIACSSVMADWIDLFELRSASFSQEGTAFSSAAQKDTAFWLESQRTYFFRSVTSIFLPRTMHARSCSACTDIKLVDQNLSRISRSVVSRGSSSN